MLAHNAEAALVAAVALVSSALEPDTMVAPADLDAFVRIDGYTTTGRRDASTPATVRALSSGRGPGPNGGSPATASRPTGRTSRRARQ
jgi:hypothetical protein